MKIHKQDKKLVALLVEMGSHLTLSGTVTLQKGTEANGYYHSFWPSHSKWSGINEKGAQESKCSSMLVDPRKTQPLVASGIKRRGMDLHVKEGRLMRLWTWMPP